MRSVLVLLLAGTAVLAWERPAAADSITLGFERMSSNASEDLAGQLTCQVTGSDASSDITFKFSNAVGTASSVDDIYFRAALTPYLGDDLGTTAFDGSVTIATSSGVSFSSPANPASPPGWTVPYSADADPPPASEGVDASSEWVSFTFSLTGSWSHIKSAFESGALDDTIGLHVQSIGANEQSDWYSNASVDPVPEPGTFALLGLGVVGLVLRRRRRHMA